jgi:hypothetical protein
MIETLVDAVATSVHGVEPAVDAPQALVDLFECSFDMGHSGLKRMYVHAITSGISLECH